MPHVVITGASRGIGAEMADRYRQAGWAVTGTSRKGGNGLVALDVSDPNGFGALRAAVGESAVDLLICNAGIYPDKGQTLDTGFGPDLWAAALATNVTGVFQSIQTLLPNIRAAEAGKIAIISSQMASDNRAPGGSYIYRASKAAALNLGRNLAVDLKSEGLAVGIYHPGWVRTEMGGDVADISVEESASGLMDEFAVLSVVSTGCFRTWDGRDHAF